MSRPDVNVPLKMPLQGYGKVDLGQRRRVVPKVDSWFIRNPVMAGAAGGAVVLALLLLLLRAALLPWVPL